MKFNFLKFWPFKKKSDTEKAEDMLKLYIKHLPQLRSAMNQNNPEIAQESDGVILGKMFDFHKDMEHGENTIAPFLSPVSMGEDKDERVDKKPVEVLAELETVPTPFNIDEEDLDAKISLFKNKSSLTSQRYTKAQIDGFTKRLENRKKYRENVKFFGQFKNTTDEKIDALLSKYKLEMNESELFIPTFPKEAIDVMTEYTKVCKRELKETPVFYVIAEEKDFKKKRKKLDPILLVQSPFGFYWQILGAWDKEMLLLSEL